MAGVIEEFVSGSTVHRVLRRMTSPVLLVPGPAKAGPVETAGEEEDDVLVATPAGALSLRTALYANQAREGGASWR